MLQHPLIELLSSLSTKEFKAFEKELQREARMNNESLKLLAHLGNYHPVYSEEKKELSEAYLLNTVLESKYQSEKTLSNLMTKIRPKLEHFIIRQQLKTQPFIAKYLLLNACKERGLQNKYEQEKKAIFKQLSNEDKIDARQNAQKFILNFDYYFSSESNKYRSKETKMEEMENALIECYLIQQLILLIEKKVRIRNHQETFSPKDVEALKKIGEGISKSKLIEWLWECLEAFDNVSLVEYQKLKTDFFEIQIQLDKSTAGICIGFLLNIGMYGTKYGKKAFFHELWELYQRIFSFKANDNFLIEHGVLDITTFNNVVSAAVIDHQFNWAVDFVNTHSQYLKKDLKKSAIQIAKAEIAFRQEDYKKATFYLEKIHKPHFSFKLRTYCLSLICYFELEEIDCSTDKSPKVKQNFAKFLYTNKELSVINKEAGLNFIRMYEQIENSTTNKTILKKILSTNQPIFYQSWFEKTINNRK